MNPAAAHAHWSRLKSLFQRCADMAPAERDFFLAAECSDSPELLEEIHALLRAHISRDTLLDDGGAVLATRLIDDAADADDASNTVLGNYRLIRLLGRGGMGQVYLAERVDGQFRHQVALKRIRGDFASPALLARFLRERQILARLQHPNIAQLHEGGVAADGNPYFTLEYVDGESLIHYCDKHRLGIEARLCLLLQVCAAVQYAHRNLIVHRDLKPSNIFVTASGEVKLLDFGIAKLLDDDAKAQTATQARVMTREYAAPEQILAQPITTATDIYALGMLLYELLCGHLPYARAERGEVSWPKAIVDEPPQALSRALTRVANAADELARTRAISLVSLQRRLRGDLDRIVARALEKAPEARYSSVGAFTADIEAHLAGHALPGAYWRHRVGKFVRRNRLVVALSTALIGSVLAAGISAVVQNRATARAAERALREVQTTAAVKDVLLGLFTAADPRQTNGSEITVREILDRGAKGIEGNLNAAPALKAELQITLGQIYHQLGLFAQASALYETAYATTRDAPELQRLAAMAERESARTFAMLGERKQAMLRAEQAYARVQSLAPRAPNDEIETLAALGMFLVQERDYARAAQLGLIAVDLARRTHAPPELLADALKVQAGAEVGQYRFADAERLQREALALHTQALGEHDRRTGSDRHDLALVLRSTGRYTEAIALLEHGLALMQRAYGKDSVHLVSQQLMLANAYSSYGDFAKAEALARQALTALRAGEGRSSGNVARALNVIGLIQTHLGQFEPAAATLQEALQIQQTRNPQGSALTTALRSNLADLHILTGQLDLAERALHEVLAAEQVAGDHSFLWTWQRLSNVYLLRNDVSAALRYGRLARDEALALHGDRSLQAAWTRCSYGKALAANGETRTAESELRGSLNAFDSLRPDKQHPHAAIAHLALATLLLQQPQSHTEALDHLHHAVAIRKLAFGSDNAATHEAEAALANARVASD